ncbi:regulator of chromosome condensation 1/beta-lactamase-inhibitor protein II [Aspergillus heterothallicus]
MPRIQAAVTAPPFPPSRPTQSLDVYVFGRNDLGQLGLGYLTDVQLPLLNPNLPAATVGVVHLAVGLVHAAALTHDNQILTWGSNINDALGRDTTVDGGDNTNLFQRQATPGPVDLAAFPANTSFTQLAVTGSATFVLTTDGLVYGWGTFMNSTGVLGFSPTVPIQPRPALIPELTNVAKIVGGANHMLALTSEGKVFSWGSNEYSQLGRPRQLRHSNPSHHLVPAQCCVPSRILDISAGYYHSFAIHRWGDVYAWGSNDWGQTALRSHVGQSIVEFPQKVPVLKRADRITSIQSGRDHCHIIDETAQCHSWGRIDNLGIGVNSLAFDPSDVVFDDQGNRSILKIPEQVAPYVLFMESLAAGTDHTVAITNTGLGYSWGLSNRHQAGQSLTYGNQIIHPGRLRSNDINGKRLNFAGCGHEFSIVAGRHTAPANNT